MSGFSILIPKGFILTPSACLLLSVFVSKPQGDSIDSLRVLILNRGCLFYERIEKELVKGVSLKPRRKTNTTEIENDS